MKLLFPIFCALFLVQLACTNEGENWRRIIAQNRLYFKYMDSLFSDSVSSVVLIREVEKFKSHSNQFKYCTVNVFNQNEGYLEYDSQNPELLDINVEDIIDDLKYNATESNTYHKKDGNLSFDFEVYENQRSDLPYKKAIRVVISKLSANEKIQGASHFSGYPILDVVKLY